MAVVIKVGDSTAVSVSVGASDDLPVGIGEKTYIGTTCPEYAGSYSVTPSQEAQYLQTAGKRMADNVRVDPIPSNYGLITWNGSTLTVS